MEKVGECMKKIFLFFIFIFLLLPFNVSYAGSIPVMSIDDASAILVNLRSGDNYKFNWYQNTSNSIERNYQLITSLHANASELMQLWNGSLTTYFNNNASLNDYDLIWNDIIFVGYGKSNNYVIRVIIQNSKGNGRLGIQQNSSNKSQYFAGTYPTGLATTYSSEIIISDDSITCSNFAYSNYVTGARIFSNISKQTCIVTNGNEVSADYCFTLGQNTLIHVNDTSNEYLLLNRPIISQPEIIPNDTDNSYGYYFYESQNTPAIPVNKLSLQNYYSLDEWWFIGDDLNYSYNYYYYSGDTKISINNLITLNTSRNSGDTGTYYFPRIYRQQLDNLPNNTGFYLDITCSLGNDTEIIIEDFYSFYTYSVVEDSGSTGTIIITNGSGETSSGEIDLSGIQVGINNISNTIENTILGEENSSGERQGGLLGGILDGIKGLFIPSSDYFYNEDENNPGLWQRFNSFFSSKLGFLWDMIIFVPNLITTIVNLILSMTEDWSITIPDISVPDFQGGQVVILNSFIWSPYTTIHQNEQIAYVYNLYLDIIDFFVYFGLVFYGVQVYNEVLGNSNQDIE